MAPETPYRLGEIDRRLARLEERTQMLDVYAAHIEDLKRSQDACRRDIHEIDEKLDQTYKDLSGKFDAVKTAVMMAAISLAGSSLLIAATIYLSK